MLRLPRSRRVSVGALGERRFAGGCYVYAGSAFGPGGLRARVRRHWSGGRARWHVDYLREPSRLLEVWWTADGRRRERDWSVALARWLGDQGVPGFGASDSPLPSHLFYAVTRPCFAQFRARVLSTLDGHAPLHCTVLTTSTRGGQPR